ncbi:DMT family transporter [Solimonas terrae]|uniref:DMT family transporter n=2 Tax=Solimonas terrae TaxID=1396819 RepID=A0A6M2BLT1_9GAMM|nr:DMT family transporter [Solimonas terrae]
MDTTTKYLAARYPAPMVVALRYIVQCLLMLVLLYPSQGRRLFQTQRTDLVLIRAGCLAVASMCLTLALQRMPVAESTAIVFLSPMLVVLMAGPVLREYVTRFGLMAAVAGFVGVLLIARPGAGLDAVGVLLAICAATANAVYQLLSRVLATTERTIALLFYTALVGAVGYGALLPWFWTGPLPPLTHLALFCSTGVLGGVGHFLFTAAHRHTAASALAPLQYAQLVWASFLGWLVFGHIPDGPGVLGMMIVAVSGGAVAMRSRLAARTLEQAAAN